MALESCRTSVFTFQSSVHSSHVLHCLDEQRQKDVFCDVTVVVENHSYRAHRSVLASCSDYFRARVSSQMGQGLVVNLPDDVTAEGFEPLLQFAYTSKLLFTKENVLEIRNCASTLGFKNLDSACFDFLLPKFFCSGKSSQKSFQRKLCCRDIWREKSDTNNVQTTSSLPENAEPKLERTENQPKCSTNLHENTTTNTHHSETKPQAKSYFCCPKYKFLQACEKTRMDAKNMSSLKSTTTENCQLAARPLQICPMIASCLGGSDPISPSCKTNLKDSTGSLRADHNGEPECLRSLERSSVEMEVANQLSTWTTVCSLQPSIPCSVPCPGANLQCPFLQDLGQSTQSPLPECPYTSSVNSDSDSLDSDGDSESGISEQASKMQLPLSVEHITSMSRNDFQNFLRTYQLTREQLDYVHDVRRRCKNRIAARRCRKRKLDCIYNLECEINKLRSERETLTAEKQQLDQMRLKTYQSYSILYERLCAEANLGPEQLQVLAKYTSLVECPFTAHMSTKTHNYESTVLELRPLASTLGIHIGTTELRENGQLASITLDRINTLESDES